MSGANRHQNHWTTHSHRVRHHCLGIFMLKELWILPSCKCHSTADQCWSWKSPRVFSFLKQSKTGKSSSFGASELSMDYWEFQSREKAFKGNGKWPHVGWLHNALQIGSSSKCIGHPAVKWCTEHNLTHFSYQDSDNADFFSLPAQLLALVGGKNISAWSWLFFGDLNG